MFTTQKYVDLAKRFMMLAKRYMGKIYINLKVDFHYTKIFQILPSWGGGLPDAKGSEMINLNKVSEGFLELPKLLIFWICDICHVAKRYMDYCYIVKCFTWNDFH